jgi:hypothetical protein
MQYIPFILAVWSLASVATIALYNVAKYAVIRSSNGI